MIKKGKFASSLISIIGPAVGSRFTIERILLSNNSGTNKLATLVISNGDGADAEGKSNLIPPAVELTPEMPFLEVLDPGQKITLSNPQILQAQSDEADKVEYLIEYTNAPA